VPPVDLDLLSGRGLKAYESPPLFACRANRTKVVFEDGVAALKAQRNKSLPNDFRAGFRVYFKQTSYFLPEGIQFTGSVENGLSSNWLTEILGYAITAKGELLGNLPDRLPFMMESVDFEYGALIDHGFSPKAWLKICRIVAGSEHSISSRVSRIRGGLGDAGREST